MRFVLFQANSFSESVSTQGHGSKLPATTFCVDAYGAYRTSVTTDESSAPDAIEGLARFQIFMSDPPRSPFNKGAVGALSIMASQDAASKDIHQDVEITAYLPSNASQWVCRAMDRCDNETLFLTAFGSVIDSQNDEPSTHHASGFKFNSFRLFAQRQRLERLQGAAA